MSLLRCPNAAAVGWGPPPAAAAASGDEDERKRGNAAAAASAAADGGGRTGAAAESGGAGTKADGAGSTVEAEAGAAAASTPKKGAKRRRRGSNKVAAAVVLVDAAARVAAGGGAYPSLGPAVREKEEEDGGLTRCAGGSQGRGGGSAAAASNNEGSSGRPSTVCGNGVRNDSCTAEKYNVQNAGDRGGGARIPGVTIEEEEEEEEEEGAVNKGDDDGNDDGGGSSVVLIFDRPSSSSSFTGRPQHEGLRGPAEAVLTGTATVTVLSGAVEIMGYTMSAERLPVVGRHEKEGGAESSTIRVFSPDGAWASALTIVDAAPAPAAASKRDDGGDHEEKGPTRVRISSLHWRRRDDGPSSSNQQYKKKKKKRTFEILSRLDVKSAVTVPERWVKAADAFLSDVMGEGGEEWRRWRRRKLSSGGSSGDVRDHGHGEEGSSPAKDEGPDDAVELDGYGNPVLPDCDPVAAQDQQEEDEAAESTAPNSSSPDGAELFDRCRALVCGAKGVGKSTYVRYLVNRMLSEPPPAPSQRHHEVSSSSSCSESGATSPDGTKNGRRRKRRRRRRKVAVLDCDVGQPELGPPGLITLTVLDSPLLSPPHSHMVCGGSSSSPAADGEVTSFEAAPDHASARFYGHVSSRADPVSYTAAIASLVGEYERLVEDEEERAERAAVDDDDVRRTATQTPDWDNREYSRDDREHALPLVVNTDGWVKGMGYEILSSVLDLVRPRHIVQIVGAARAKFFDMTGHAAEGRSVHAVEAFGRVTRLPTAEDERQRQLTPPPSRGASPVPPPGAAASGGPSSVEGGGGGPATSPRPTGVADCGGGAPTASTTSTLRSLRLASYFLGGYADLLGTGATFRPTSGGMFDPDCAVPSALAAMRPYAVPFGSVLCSVPGLTDLARGDSVCGGTMAENELVLQSLNGSIVGLCLWDGSYEGDVSTECAAAGGDAHGDVRTCPAGINASLLPCAGLGIVRSVDRVSRRFFVLTPIPAERLRDFPPNVIVRAQVQLPLECVFRGVRSESLPNQNCDGILSGIGDDVMKSRNAVVKK